MIKKLCMAVGALWLALSLPLTGFAKEQKFSDVPDSKHFAKAVNELAARNIIGGYPDGTFKPGNPITRGQAAAIIAKLTKVDMTDVKNPNFKDVSTENGYYKAIAALAEQGVIGGYQDGRYGVNDPVKRGQLASILVKAFDLPRYNFYDTKNPFKDVVEYQSHGKEVMILYRLGITTGVTPDRFGINEQVTRGQAAKLMKATEENKPAMESLTGSELGFDSVPFVAYAEDQDIYEAISVPGKEGYSQDRLQLVPLKEGKATLNLGGDVKDSSSENGTKLVFKKYYVQVKKVNGVLKLTLEATDDFLPTDVPVDVLKGEQIKKISLSTIDGELVSDKVAFGKCSDRMGTCFQVDSVGSWIATVTMADGKEVRYAVEAKKPEKSYFHYEIKVLREQLSRVFDVEELMQNEYYYEKEDLKHLGKHKIVTPNAGEIAEITRDPGTNVFRVAAKKPGTVEVMFENKVYWRSDPADAMSGYTVGMRIKVQKVNGIMNITPERIIEVNPDM